MSSVVIPFSTAITHLGLGYDTATSRVKASPFLYEPEAETVLFHTNNNDSDAPAQSAVEYKLRLIQSRSELASSLNISGKFAAKRSNLSGSISGSFLDQEINTKSNAYLLVTVEVMHSVTTLASSPEVDPAKVPNGDSETSITDEAFRELYGDGFVSSIQVGGRLDGLVEIAARSEEDLLEINATATLEMENVASGEVSLDYVVGNLTRNRQAKVNVVILGGGISFSPMDPRSLVRLCKGFPLMVSGGSTNLRNYHVTAKTETVEGVPVTTEEQNLEIIPVNFAGIAVPLRAVVSLYKSLPVFNYTPPVLARLSGFVTDDLLEYYYSYDNAKNKIADLIANDNGSFTSQHLETLGLLRGEIREIQASLLNTFVENTKLSDKEAAESTKTLIAELDPAELKLRKALDVQDEAIALIMQQREEEDNKARLQAQLKQEAKQRLEYFRTRALNVGEEGILNGDRVTISTVSGLVLGIVTPTTAFKWMVDDEERILPTGISNEESFESVNSFHKKALSKAYSVMVDQLETQLQAGALDPLDYVTRGKVLYGVSADEVAFFSTVQKSVEEDETPFESVLTKIENAVVTVASGTTTSGQGGGTDFIVNVIDGEKGLVRFEDPANNKYWRHTLQYGQYGVVALEDWDLTDEDDKSYIFQVGIVNLSGDSSTVEIRPQAGELDWKLFTEREEGGSNLICGGSYGNVGRAGDSRTDQHIFRMVRSES